MWPMKACMRDFETQSTHISLLRNIRTTQTLTLKSKPKLKLTSPFTCKSPQQSRLSRAPIYLPFFLIFTCQKSQTVDPHQYMQYPQITCLT